MTTDQKAGLTPRQQFLSDLWDEHLQHEFVHHDTEDALDTMIPRAHVNHVPVITGGRHREELRRFYSTWFIPTLPPDMTMVEVSRTVGADSLAFEFVATFTHTTGLAWMLPGVPPTGKRIELAAVGVVQFDGDKIASEQLYWDQASVLVQIGLLDRDRLPVVGAEAARKVLDPSLPSNQLIEATLPR
jgi:carboxymethylenebutenolidase